jgi:hypothetical protein
LQPPEKALRYGHIKKLGLGNCPVAEKNYPDEADGLNSEKMYDMELNEWRMKRTPSVSPSGAFQATVTNSLWDEGKKQSFYDTIAATILPDYSTT